MNFGLVALPEKQLLRVLPPGSAIWLLGFPSW
jgi:hypothetical protein